MSTGQQQQVRSPFRDPTWQRALEIAQEELRVGTVLWSAFRNGWIGNAEPVELLKAISMSHIINPAALLAAAEMPLDRSEQSAESLLHAMSMIGVQMSTAVLAINYVGASILKKRPPPVWRTIFEEMMTSIEIGAKFGARVPLLSSSGGALIGFAKGAGLGLLLMNDPAAFLRWHRQTGGFEGKELLLSSFGCEPYQVSACALQQLGFGADISIGAALATGSIEAPLLEIGPEVLRWKAAFLWIEALREGRNYPRDPEMRSYFREIAPPQDSSARNLVLESLYVDVAKVKRDGSRWTWHLPKPTYEETAKSLERVAKPLKSAG